MTDVPVLIYPTQQPSDTTCAHACLAAVTGLAIDYLIVRFRDRPLGYEEEATVLTEYGILPVPMPPYSLASPMPHAGTYFLTTPSLNRPGDMHRVIAHYSYEDGWSVIDPNEGRDGKLFWPRDALKSGPFNYCEPIYLQPLHKHKGSQDRLALYSLAGSKSIGRQAQ